MKTQVIIVKSAPAIGKPEMMGGIRSKEAAEVWAKKNGYSTVYLWLERERVYADKLTKAVHVLAKQIQTKSGRLLEISERGKAQLEYSYVAALIVIVVIFGLRMLGR